MWLCGRVIKAVMMNLSELLIIQITCSNMPAIDLPPLSSSLGQDGITQSTFKYIVTVKSNKAPPIF